MPFVVRVMELHELLPADVLVFELSGGTMAVVEVISISHTLDHAWVDVHYRAIEARIYFLNYHGLNVNRILPLANIRITEKDQANLLLSGYLEHFNHNRCNMF